MKTFWNIILYILEHILPFIAWFVVSYYGIKYTFIAGPIFFGTTAGYIIATVIVAFYLAPFIERLIDKRSKKNESNSIKGIE